MNHTIEPDNIDAQHRLTSASLEAASSEIKARHDALIQSREDALTKVSEVCAEAVSIAAIVEQAHSILGGVGFAKWWRDQEMPAGWGKKYLTLARTKRDNLIADKDQLRLIGIIPEAANHNDQHQERQQNPFAWIKWSNKISKTFSQMDIKSFDETDRLAALKHLQPIKEIIANLEGNPQVIDV